MKNEGMKQVKYSLEEYGQIFGVIYLITQFKTKQQELKTTISKYRKSISEIPQGEELACFNPIEKSLYAESLKECNQQLKKYENELWKYGNDIDILLGKKKENDTSFDIELVKSTPIQLLLDKEPKRKSGNRLYYVCPLHEETDASFIVYKKTNSFYCHGCHRGGDIIELYMQLYKLDKSDSGSFRRACNEILKLR